MTKKSNHLEIPILPAMGVLISLLFLIIYGSILWLRYILGALMFATLTVTFVRMLNSHYGQKKIRIW